MLEDVRQSRAVPRRRPEGDGKRVVVVVGPGQVQVLGAGALVLEPHHRIQKQLRHLGDLGHLEALHLGPFFYAGQGVTPPQAAGQATQPPSRLSPHAGVEEILGFLSYVLNQLFTMKTCFRYFDFRSLEKMSQNKVQKSHVRRVCAHAPDLFEWIVR